MTIQELTNLIMQQAHKKGFGTNPSDIDVIEKIALIHSEVSEAYTAYRHKNIDGKDGFREELGDIVGRVLHLCGVLSIDIEKEIIKKIKLNEDRDWDWKNLNENNK